MQPSLCCCDGWKCRKSPLSASELALDMATHGCYSHLGLVRSLVRMYLNMTQVSLTENGSVHKYLGEFVLSACLPYCLLVRPSPSKVCGKKSLYRLLEQHAFTRLLCQSSVVATDESSHFHEAVAILYFFTDG